MSPSQLALGIRESPQRLPGAVAYRGGVGEVPGPRAHPECQQPRDSLQTAFAGAVLSLSAADCIGGSPRRLRVLGPVYDLRRA